MKTLVLAALLLLAAIPATCETPTAETYTGLPIVWEGVVGVDILDECTTRVWYERIFSGCFTAPEPVCVLLFELSIYYVDDCPDEPSPRVRDDLYPDP